MTLRVLGALGMVAIIGLTGVGVVAARDGSVPADWQAVRAAVARYHSLGQAARDGYTVENEPCVAEPALGVMGIHAINPGLMGDSVIDPRDQ